MTDTNEPAVPGTPATPPPPTGQPVGQPEYAQAAAPAAAPARSTGKFVAGIIMTIIGGLWTLGGLANIAIAAAAFSDNPGYALGRIVGGLLLPIAVLVVGIVLLRSSKPKVQ
jgi:hypothetical protein